VIKVHENNQQMTLKECDEVQKEKISWEGILETAYKVQKHEEQLQEL
jgi:hypothetical protein